MNIKKFITWVLILAVWLGYALAFVQLDPHSLGMWGLFASLVAVHILALLPKSWKDEI